MLIDPENGLYDIVRFDPEWAIQDIAEIKDEDTGRLVKRLKELL